MKSQKIKTLMKIIAASILIVILGTSSIMAVDAASIENVYGKSGKAAVDTYNDAVNWSFNNTVSFANNTKNNNNNENIIVIGDSNICQLINFDKITKKNKISGLAIWGQTYNRKNNSYSIIGQSKKVVSNTYTADNYIKTQLIKPALNSNKPLHIWVFGTVNETSTDPNATKFIAYVKELKDYCAKTNKNKKVIIHAVDAVNEAEPAYNKAINDTFNKNILIGDVNQDGEVDITDATSIQQYVVQLKKLNKDQKIAADVNGNGQVEATDATTLQRYLIKVSVHSIIGTYHNGKENTGNVAIIAENYHDVIIGKDKTYCDAKYFKGIPVFGFNYTSDSCAEYYTSEFYENNKYGTVGLYGTVVTEVNSNNYGYDNWSHYTINTLEAIGNWVIDQSKKLY